jgi:hypothetical protein
VAHTKHTLAHQWSADVYLVDLKVTEQHDSVYTYRPEWVYGKLKDYDQGSFKLLKWRYFWRRDFVDPIICVTRPQGTDIIKGQNRWVTALIKQQPTIKALMVSDIGEPPAERVHEMLGRCSLFAMSRFNRLVISQTQRFYRHRISERQWIDQVHVLGKKLEGQGRLRLLSEDRCADLGQGDTIIDQISCQGPATVISDIRRLFQKADQLGWP